MQDGRTQSGRANLKQYWCWQDLCSSHDGPDPNPVARPILVKYRAEIFSNTLASVWRKVPKAFPDYSSVLRKFGLFSFRQSMAWMHPATTEALFGYNGFTNWQDKYTPVKNGVVATKDNHFMEVLQTPLPSRAKLS